MEETEEEREKESTSSEERLTKEISNEDGKTHERKKANENRDISPKEKIIVKEEIVSPVASAQDWVLEEAYGKENTSPTHTTSVKKEIVDYAKARAENRKRKAQILTESYERRQSDDNPTFKVEHGCDKTDGKGSFDYAKARSENQRLKNRTIQQNPQDFLEGLGQKPYVEQAHIECERKRDELKAEKEREKRWRRKNRKRERERAPSLVPHMEGGPAHVRRDAEEVKAERKRAKRDTHRQKRRGKKKEWKRQEAR